MPKSRKTEIIADWENLCAQIDAIQAKNIDKYFQLAGRPPPFFRGGSIAHQAWGSSATTPELSLFKNLPRCDRCITQAKKYLNRGGASRQIKAFDKKLGFSTNDLIPPEPFGGWEPSLATLYEFAGLQLIAVYGEAACRKAGVLEDD